jgi:hypothetical protein
VFDSPELGHDPLFLPVHFTVEFRPVAARPFCHLS